MDFNNSIIFLLLHFFLFFSLVNHVYSSKTSYRQLVNQTFRQEEYFQKLRKTKGINLQPINKHAVKTIRSPDGDIIDCIMIHKQPAFDHPLLKGHKLLDPPEIPNGHNETSILNDNFQLWSLSGESCPDKTIPILRNKQDDIISRPNTHNIFERESINRDERTRHEYVIARVNEGEYYGGKAIFNVWAPHVEQNEFSVAQMWVASGNEENLNTIEVGWQVYPGLYRDNLPKLFIYWTADTYKKTGCYNLKCPGFVQINKKILLGGTLTKISTYNGKQFIFTAMVWKDPKTKNWWLRIGYDVIGYWPSSLFPLLQNHANTVYFGGEIVDNGPIGTHTTTQMGSGHFANEGFRKAAYIRKLQVVDFNNYLNPIPNPQFDSRQQDCYDIKHGINKLWGNYIYYGGPGRNGKCI
uniref:Uncharacterized protein LOC101508099 n=1 Tax=Cicer arietinum TaxID=3827 RepID=A0A3Q7XGQ5_CICAR|nr:uncharacterized protein LOC101508099 [Cicer arietinum]